MVNRSPVESAGIVKDYGKFKSAADTDLGDFKNRYDLYSMYMKDVDRTPKQAKDMTPSDYAMMEIISRSYKPDPNIFSRYTEPKKATGGKPTQAEQKAKITESIADDVFSTDANKSNDAISQIQGALELGGYSISKSGNTLNVFKGKDIYDPNGLDIKIPLDKNNKKSVSTLKTLIKKYITATGG